MVNERSLVFVKPPHSARSGEIFEYFDEWLSPNVTNFSRTPSKELILPRSVVAAHYANIRDLYPDAYEDCVRTLNQDPIAARVYTGEAGLCAAIRLLVGHTDPAKAETGTIRRTFSTDTLAKSREERRAVRNVMHSSGSPLEGEAEILRFMPYLGQLSYIPFSERARI